MMTHVNGNDENAQRKAYLSAQSLLVELEAARQHKSTQSYLLSSPTNTTNEERRQAYHDAEQEVIRLATTVADLFRWTAAEVLQHTHSQLKAALNDILPRPNSVASKKIPT